jgi:hypothetical protein
MEMSQGNIVAILNQQKMSFLKNREQKGKTVPVWGLAPLGGGKM